MRHPIIGLYVDSANVQLILPFLQVFHERFNVNWFEQDEVSDSIFATLVYGSHEDKITA